MNDHLEYGLGVLPAFPEANKPVLRACYDMHTVERWMAVSRVAPAMPILVGGGGGCDEVGSTYQCLWCGCAACAKQSMATGYYDVVHSSMADTALDGALPRQREWAVRKY